MKYYINEAQEREIKNLNNLGFSRKEISEILGIKMFHLVKHIKKMGIPKKPVKKIAEETREEILNDFLNGCGSGRIREKYNIDYNRLVSILDFYNIKKRESNKNYNYNGFFREINSEETAYFFGLLLADGSVSYNRKYKIRNKKMSEKLGRMNISLQERDGYIVDLLGEKLNIPPSKLVLVDKGEGRQKQKKLSLCCTELAEDLRKNGMFPNKTAYNEMPSIKKDLLPHFIRGYFDGDGCASYSIANGYIKHYIEILATDIFCKEIKTIFEDDVTKENVSIRVKESTYQKNLMTVSLKSRAGIKDFYHYIYDNATIFLTRKKEKIEEILRLSSNGSRVLE